MMNKKTNEQAEKCRSYQTAWYRRLWQERFAVSRTRRKRWLLAIAFVLTAFCLGRMSIIGESAPFSAGFFGAVLVYSPIWAWCALGASVLGALSSHTLGDVLLLVSAALLIWQGYIRWGMRRKYVRTPLLVGGASLGIGWLYQLLAGGSLYDWLVALISALLSVLSASLCLYGFRVFCRREDEIELPVRQVQEGFLAMVALLALAVAGIGDMMWLDYGIQMVAGSLLSLTLLFVTELGIGLAGCIGLGFVIGIGDGNVSMTMAEYAMAGLAGGALKSLGKGGVALGFLAGLGGMLLCFDPYGALWYMMVEATVGCALFLLVPIRYLRELRDYLTDVAIGEKSEERIERARDKLTAMETLFLHMADVWQGRDCMMEETDNQAQTAAILAAAHETACSRCEKRKDCWEDDFFAVSQEVLSLVDGHGQSRCAGETFAKRCPSAEKIGASLEKVMHQEAESRYWRTQCAMQQSLLAEQMRSIGMIFRQMEAELEPQQQLRRRQQEKIAKRLSVWGCRAEELTIGAAGTASRIEIVCPSCGGKRVCESRILPFLEQVLGMRLRMSVICGVQNRLRRCRLFFVTQERIRILTGMVGVGKTVGEPSGDTCEILSLTQGQTAILLSDGMGCGRQASGDSQESIALLKQLLLAGFAAETAVKTVNSLLLLRSERERFATVDVLVINKYTGEADFIKIGAPPAFIKRQSEVLVVRDDSLPLGIVEQVAARPIRVSLENGDFVVLMSDGILDIPEERLPSGHTKESWVRSQIRLFSGKSPQSLAEHLAMMAMRLSGRTLHDDMTVVAVKIKTVSRG